MNKSHLLLLLILLLAAGLRLGRLDLAEFKADEAGVARAALALVHEGRFPAVGPGSSQGPAHPPLHIYALALPFALSQDPRLAVALVALLHTAAVGMTYLLGDRFFSRRVGLIAAFLFAVNPWAVYYARKMWTQNWPLATTLFIYCLLLWAVERRRWALTGAALALIPLVGTHLGGLAFLGVLALAVIGYRRGDPRGRPGQGQSRGDPRGRPGQGQALPLLVGLAVFGVLALPYLLHDAAHGWANLRGLLGLGSGPAQIDGRAVQFAAWLSSGTHFQDLAGARHAQFLAGLPPLRWLDGVEMALFGAGAVYLFVVGALAPKRFVVGALAPKRGAINRALRTDCAPRTVLLLWLLVPVALQTRHTAPVYPHYFILLYPVQHLLIAILLNDGLAWLTGRLGARAGRWGTVALLALVLAIGGWQVYLQEHFLNFVARYDTPDGYGPVLGPARRAAGLAAEAAADGAELLVVAPGDDRVWDNEAAAQDVLLPWGAPRRLVDGREALVYPQGPTVYVVTPGVTNAVGATPCGRPPCGRPPCGRPLLPGAALVGQVEAPGERCFWVLRRENVSRDDVLAGMTPLEPPVRLANGVVLMGYNVEGAAEGGLVLRLAWWLDGPPPVGTSYHSFAQLVDADGRMWGQHDMEGFPTAAWHAGDLVVARFPVATDAPPGTYWFRVGMYAYPEVVNAPVVDAAGNPVADWALLGPFSR